MKKLFLATALLFGITATINAQDISDNALGLRLGDNDGFGGEISYQRGFSDENRLELDLGWRSNKNVNAFKLTGIYQWVWNIEGGFNWYAGFGGGLGSWNYDYSGVSKNGTILFAAGDLGIEYNFDEAPIQLSLDIRPELYLISDDFYRNDSFGPDIALGVRYKF